MSIVTSRSESLRVGDTVLFYFKTAEKCGYVYSELSSSAHNFLSLYPSSVKDPIFSNVNFAAFKVLAPNKYKATQRLKELQENENAPEYEISNAKRAVESENAENVQEQAKRLGSQVVYGDLVQFLHIGSKKYVTVCSEASRTESNNLLVNMCPDNSEGAIFKILPRYKVRSEGDGIHFHDQIKLESFKTQGQFLHVGLRAIEKAGYRVTPNNYEVNLSATESALSLKPHYMPSSKHPSGALRGGRSVRLFHKEDECYIVAEGSFASSSSPVLEEVHCRQRRVDSKSHSMPSTSANTFWQIEKVDETSGDVISWGESCRIKHMPTRMYLSVDFDFQVKLKQRTSEDETDSDTLFSFHPLIQEGDEVLFESYACIKHLLSGEWLHLEKKMDYERRSFNPDAKGLAGLQWDSAELFTLKTRRDRGDYDSFTLQEVTEDLLDGFNFLAGIVPVLSAHIECIADDGSVRSSEKQSSNVKECLYEVRKWIVTHDDRSTKNRQKLLRNLRVVEQLVEILRSGNFDDIKPSQKAICKECYNVIKRYLEGDSRKNENYLAKFIENFQHHVRKELNAEEVLVEIVQDNINIVSRMAETQLDSMIDQFCLTRDPRFLTFLSSLCVCNDRPIPFTQERLLKSLVFDKGQDIFIRMCVKDVEGGKAVYYHSPNEKGNLVLLRKLGNPETSRRRTLSHVKDQTQSQLIYDLLDAQLYLFTRLCKGNNKDSIKALMFDPETNQNGYIDFNLAINVVKDDRIDIILRLRFAEIMLVMFVDVGNNRSFLDHLCYSFVFDEIVSEPYADTGNAEGETTALTGAENEHFPAIKAWILGVLDSYKQLRSDLNSDYENQFVETVIDVLSALVRYGYFDDIDDVNVCIKRLMKILNGKTDLPSPGKEMSPEDMKIYKDIERKKNLPENKAVFQVKQKALQVMELFFRFKFYVKLQKFIHDFKVLKGKSRKSVKSKGTLLSDSDPDPPHALTQLMGRVESSDQRLYQPHVRRAAMVRLQYISNKGEKGCGFAPRDNSSPSLESILMDLSTYDSDVLVFSSLNLLIQMYFFEEELFDKAVQAQLLIAPQSIQDFKLVNDEILPELRQLLRVDSNRSVQDRIAYLLNQLSELCVTSGETFAEVKPIEQNQIMLDNLGVVSEILTYVLSKGQLEQSQQTSEGDSVSVREEVFTACFYLLRLLATGRINVQKRLYNRLDDLLELHVPGETLELVADLLTEVFTGGPELVLKVSESLIEKIFEIIVDSDSSKIQAAFMITLQAMAKVIMTIEEYDLPVGRNHAIIVKNFCRLRHSFCEEIIAEKDGMDEKRMEILLKEEETSLLQVLLGVTDLLATCAESRNLFIESVCRNIFSIEELLRIMTHKKLNPQRKVAFVKFFIFVYMKKGSGKDGYEINHGTEIWSYLESIGNLLNNIVRYFESIPMEERTSVSEEFALTGRKTTSAATSAAKHLQRSMSVKMVDVTDEAGHIIPGLLEYIADGIIPLLHEFYCSFFKPEEANPKQKEKEYEVSVSITKSLANLSREVLAHFSTNSKLLLYQDTLAKLLEFERIEIDSDIDIRTVIPPVRQERSIGARKKSATLKRTATVTTESNVALLPKSVFSDYETQYQLNCQFNRYARNYGTVYHGRNTAAAQIMSPVQDIEYSDEGEELPLGPSFQRLLSLFCDSAQQLRPEVESLLRQLEISQASTEQIDENDQLVQEILDKRCLQILRALVMNHIKVIDPELKDRDAIKFRKKFDSSVVPIQNQLQGFSNAIRRVMPLLSHANEFISRGALALMKTLLFSGNTVVQEGLCVSLESTREETLFLNLKHRIEIATLNFKESEDLEKQIKRRQETLTIHKKPEQETDTVSPDHGEAATALSRRETGPDRTTLAISMNEMSSTARLTENMEQTEPESSIRIQKQLPLENDAPAVLAEEHDDSDEEKVLDLKGIIASDNTWTTLVLEVIGLMCDGQHRTLQNYLREQTDNFKTVNVVAEVANFLHTYTATSPSQNLVQVHKILQCLIEMCVGNVENQKVILDKLIIEPLNRILQLPQPEKNDFTAECEECEHLVELIQAKGSVVELISVMLEEISPDASKVVQGIGSSIDEQALIETMEFLWMMRSHPVIRRKEMDDDCERGMFRAYHVVTTLIDHEKSSYKDIKAIKKSVQGSKDAINECDNHTKTVEIHYENETTGKPVLARVHFPYSSQNTLREDITEKVRWNINRDSMEDKQRSLLDLMPAMKRDINHQAKLKRTKILRPFLAYHTIRVYFLMALTLLLNLFVLFTYSVPDEDINDDSFIVFPSTPGWFFRIVLFVFGVVHLIMSLWIVVEYFLINWPHFQLPRFFYFYWYKMVQIALRERNFRQLPQFTFLDKNIFGIPTLYMLLFLVCSILSLVFRGYFYCVCLLFIIFTSDILQRVLRAVTVHGKSLLWVAVLGLVVLFIYSVISFAWLHNYFQASSGLFCDTLSRCFYSMIKIGLLDTLASSIPLNSSGPTTEYTAHLPGRLIFDLSFFIIVTTIGLNIVFGIIVDSFGELREQRTNVEAEQKSRCFICDLASYDFERRAKGFRNHIKQDHNMWDYVYYCLYVDTIDTGDHNAIQKYVYEKVAENDTCFFPQEEACCLIGDDDSTTQKLEELQEKVEGILQRFKEKDHEKTVRAKKTNQLKFEADLKARRTSSLSRGSTIDIYRQVSAISEEDLSQS